jgi:hypothetical protein
MREVFVMCFFRKKKFGIKLIVFWLTVFMISPGGLALAGSDRIYPTGKVTLYRDDKIVGEFTKEAPLPEGVDHLGRREMRHKTGRPVPRGRR